MAKTQKLKLQYSFIDSIVDRGDKGLEVKMIGMNTKGTRVEISTFIEGWDVNNLNHKYREIVDKRIQKAIEVREGFILSVQPK